MAPVALLLVALVFVGLGGMVAWLAGFAVRRWAPSWGLIDVPSGRKDHPSPTPLGGGLAIAAGIVASLAAFTLAAHTLATEAAADAAVDGALAHWPAGLMGSALLDVLRSLAGGTVYAWGILAGAALVFAIGLADDLRGLGWRVRLIVQCIAAGLVVLGLLRAAPLGPIALVGIAPVATLWIVALVNSLNMLDNMDGLAGGVTAICGTFLAFALPEADAAGALPGAGVLLWALVGGALGFLWHNFPPARLFMGDAGSYLAGFILGSLSVLATVRAGANWPAELAPLLVFAVPLYDMLSVLAIRLAAGRSPFAADHSHVSHRLVALGLSRRQAVLALCSATAATGALALALSRASPIAAVWILVAFIALASLAAGGELVAHRRRAAVSHERS